MAKKRIIAPSVLGADWLHMHDEITKLQAAGINRIHYDVMDYHLVYNLTFGVDILKQIHQAFPDLFIDGHFMVKIRQDMSLADYFKPFIEAGVNLLNVDFHAFDDRENGIEDFLALKEKYPDISLGFAISTDVSVKSIKPYLKDLNLVTVMTVSTGFGGLKFQPHCLTKVTELRQLVDQGFCALTILVDGGINNETAKDAWNAGADMLVSGSYLFKQNDYALALQTLILE